MSSALTGCQFVTQKLALANLFFRGIHLHVVFLQGRFQGRLTMMLQVEHTTSKYSIWFLCTWFLRLFVRHAFCQRLRKSTVCTSYVCTCTGKNRWYR
jgi:hypothetical protein